MWPHLLSHRNKSHTNQNSDGSDLHSLHILTFYMLMDKCVSTLLLHWWLEASDGIFLRFIVMCMHHISKSVHTYHSMLHCIISVQASDWPGYVVTTSVGVRLTSPAHATECGQHYLKIPLIDFFFFFFKQCGFKSVHAHVDEATDSFS